MPKLKKSETKFYYRDICMINNIQDEKIVSEIKALIKGIDSVKEEVNIYCNLMKQIFLSCSGEN